MRTFLRWAARVLVVLVGAVFVGGATVWVASERRLAKTYDVPATTLAARTDSASLARGEHLVNAMLSCRLCHGDDLGGTVYADMGPIGVVAGANLTRGQGGVGATFADSDWVRALRFGVRRDGTSLIAMPSEVFTHLRDEDLASIIGYLKSVPSVDRASIRSHFGPMGRTLLSVGKLELLVAKKTPRPASRFIGDVAPTKDYGRYIADISGCHGCHGYGLSGGKVAGPPGLPPASNLTPSGAIATWSEAQFAAALRTGKRPDGGTINTFMPWRVFAGMTDDEVRALYLYLRSVPPKEFGHK